MAAALSPDTSVGAQSKIVKPSHPPQSDEEIRGEEVKEAFVALAGEDGTQVSVEKLRSTLQEFDLVLRLDELLEQLQDSRPPARLDEPVEVLTLDDFSSLFQ